LVGNPLRHFKGKKGPEKKGNRLNFEDFAGKKAPSGWGKPWLTKRERPNLGNKPGEK